jgi:K+ transporter
MVPLRQVAEFKPSLSERQIERRNLQRQIQIWGGVGSNATSGEVLAEVRKITAAATLPPGYRFDYGGDGEMMAESGKYALIALGIAVIFIYLVLASQFGSFLQPLAIMASLPLSLIGVFLALMIFGSTLNIFSVIGFIMLMGLVTKNAILLVDFTNQGIREGKDRLTAILDAGQVRLRPILMTTAAMVFGMLPLALGHHFKHSKVLHERIVLLSITTEHVPAVPRADRVRVEFLGEGFVRVSARYGFTQSPSITDVLRQIAATGVPVSVEEASFFLGRVTVLASGKRELAGWRKRLFSILHYTAQPATGYFGIPPGRAVELGMQITI